MDTVLHALPAMCLKQFLSLLMLCVTAYRPKPANLTLIHGGLTEQILFFSKTLSLNSTTVAHIYLVPAQLNPWAAPLTQSGQCNRRDPQHQSVLLIQFPKWVFLFFLFFIQHEGWNQWPSKHIPTSLISGLLLLPSTYLTKMIAIAVCTFLSCKIFLIFSLSRTVNCWVR